ncbi:hypothetical protein Mmc1_2350 [Magnetococcus marinus MC-1]|uniref:Uncharacterized protein n=1 Tax=Magnetococcus marinus (strain ATCC BAA-1437 / JCM 17883 / MC-1) TaxID=156889 RepID=A0LA57_MAGMM|nr:hypothetical protein [Magnetococcus marinus]ABK44850.1 hypothetical protein Mmc1_2350 [Magnetococcus marinus MC-1]
MDKAKKMLRKFTWVAGLTVSLMVCGVQAQAADVVRGEASNHIYYPDYALPTHYPVNREPVLVVQWAVTGPTFYTMGNRQIPLEVVYPTSQKKLLHGNVVMARVMRFTGSP